MRTLIIIVSILVIGMTVGTIIVGKQSFDGVVVEKPYETGLDWDRHHQHQARLGWTVTVTGSQLQTGKNNLIIEALDRNGKPLTDARINVRTSRPSTNRYDRSYGTDLGADGRYHADVDLPLKGNWDVMIDVARGDEKTRFRKRIFAEQSAGEENTVPSDVQAGSCIGKTNDGTEIEFDIRPKPVTSMTELTLIVKVDPSGKPVKNLEVDFTMPGMYMGKNRPVLKQVSNGRYEGKIILTKCASGRKTWKAEVMITMNDKIESVGFLFEVK